MSLLSKIRRKKNISRCLYFIKYIPRKTLFTVLIFVLRKIISVHEIIWKCCIEMLVSATVEKEPFHFIERCFLKFSKKYYYRNWLVSAKCFWFGDHHIFSLQNLLAQSALWTILLDQCVLLRTGECSHLAHHPPCKIFRTPVFPSDFSLEPKAPKELFYNVTHINKSSHRLTLSNLELLLHTLANSQHSTFAGFDLKSQIFRTTMNFSSSGLFLSI